MGRIGRVLSVATAIVGGVAVGVFVLTRDPSAPQPDLQKPTAVSEEERAPHKESPPESVNEAKQPAALPPTAQASAERTPSEDFSVNNDFGRSIAEQNRDSAHKDHGETAKSLDEIKKDDWLNLSALPNGGKTTDGFPAIILKDFPLIRASADLKVGTTVEIPLDAGSVIRATVTSHYVGSSHTRLELSVSDLRVPDTSMSLTYAKDGALADGSILSPASSLAYKILPAGAARTSIIAVPASTLLPTDCKIDHPLELKSFSSEYGGASTHSMPSEPAVGGPISQTSQSTLPAIPPLQSFPENPADPQSLSAAVVYLDFDGHITQGTSWNQYLFHNFPQITSLPLTTWGASETVLNVPYADWVRSTVERVAANFSPFTVNITTDESVFNRTPLQRRLRVVISPSSKWYTCRDGVDNDLNGMTDTFDPSCRGTSIDTHGEITPLVTEVANSCRDGRDNNGDGKTDATDPFCFGEINPVGAEVAASCRDGGDNNGDGMTDAADPGCQDSYGEIAPSGAEVVASCRDGRDNDGDGRADAADPGCQGSYGEIAPLGAEVVASCRDGLDNNRNTTTDAADPGCQGSYGEIAPLGIEVAASCQDGRDNDGNTMIDANDPRCASNPATGEPGRYSASGTANFFNHGSQEQDPDFIFTEPLTFPRDNEGRSIHHQLLINAITHEVGHSLGLSHWGRINNVQNPPLNEEYFFGQRGWAPFMGFPTVFVAQWSKGEYPFAKAVRWGVPVNGTGAQDDLAKLQEHDEQTQIVNNSGQIETVITHENTGVNYRTDDWPSDFASADARPIPFATDPTSGTPIPVRGIIEQASDKDVFRFSTSGGTGTVTINSSFKVHRFITSASALAILSPDRGSLNIQARLLKHRDENGVLLNPPLVVATHSPPLSEPQPDWYSVNLSAVYQDISLSRGEYFLEIQGVGDGDATSTGFSNYGSLGEYEVLLNLPLALPVPDTATPTSSPTSSPSPAATSTPTATRQATSTATHTQTPTHTSTHTATPSGTPHPTNTPTHSPSPASTVTATPTATVTSTITSSPTSTPLTTDTATHTPTHTPSPQGTPSSTPTDSPSPSVTPTATGTPTATATPTGSNGDPQPQCDDATDNDQDGLIDMLDPGCDSPTDISESSERATIVPLLVMLEGVVGDTAYLSYVNSTDAPISIPIGDSSSGRNLFSPGDPSRGQPIVFAPGAHRGEIRIPASQPVSWTIKHGDYPEIRVEVSSSGPPLPAIQPLADCVREPTNRSLTAVLGYRNPNEFDVELPVGPLNGFSPGAINLGQPTKFQPGLRRGEFVVPLSGELVWTLGALSTKVDASTGICQCPLTDNRATRTKIVSLTQQLGELAFGAAHRLESASAQRLRSGSQRGKERAHEAIKKAKNRAAEFVLDFREAAAKLPLQSLSCPTVLDGCRNIDDGKLLRPLRYDLIDILAWMKRILFRASYLETGYTAGATKEIDAAEALVTELSSELHKIPEGRTECGVQSIKGPAPAASSDTPRSSSGSRRRRTSASE